jgi:hypothetical protein
MHVRLRAAVFGATVGIAATDARTPSGNRQPISLHKINLWTIRSRLSRLARVLEGCSEMVSVLLQDLPTDY